MIHFVTASEARQSFHIVTASKAWQSLHIVTTSEARQSRLLLTSSVTASVARQSNLNYLKLFLPSTNLTTPYKKTTDIKKATKILLAK